MREKLLAAVIFSIFILSTNLQADSIWAKRDRNRKDLYSDNTARNVGDVLTIIVNEESKLDNKATRTLSKETTRSQDLDNEIGINDSQMGTLRLGAGTTFSNKLDGKADYKDERLFSDSVTVIVVDVMPNGNLVIFGTCDRNIADDIQQIEISGIVRVSDIAFDNTILSRQVANFSIITRNKGVAAQYVRPNWVGRIFDLIWPF